MQINYPKNITHEQARDGGMIFAVLVSSAIVFLGLLQINIELADPTGKSGFFYEWQLANPTFWTQASVWVSFVIHNFLIWGTIWWAQERSNRRYEKTLKPVNMIALGINGFFILLHYLQTAIFYDGIAQDLPGWTSQGAVIMMLFVIMMMENRRRGMFFGKKLNFRTEFYDWLKRYHGYAFSFAVIYTFWFHPMIPTLGHILGFIHVMVVMLQGSLMFTKTHVNRKWIFLNEILVLPHAAFVALNQGSGIVYMFLFGFLTIFIVTQMHGLSLKAWVKNLFYAGFVLSLVLTYTFVREPYMANEVIRIPMIDYLLVFLTYGLWWVFFQIGNRIDSLSDMNQPIASGD